MKEHIKVASVFVSMVVMMFIFVAIFVGNIKLMTWTDGQKLWFLIPSFFIVLFYYVLLINAGANEGN